MNQQPPATLTAARDLTAAELINHLVVAVDEQDVRFVCFWLERMHEKGMLYACNGRNGVDKPDVFGRSAITAVATAEFSQLRELILQLLLFNLDGDPAQTSVFHELVGELQEWACMMLHGWVSSGRREAGAAQALLRLDDLGRAAWITENLPPSPCPVLTGIRFLAPRPVQPLPRRTSPRPHTVTDSRSTRHLPPAPPSWSTSFSPSNSPPQPPLPQRSFSHLPPPPFQSTCALPVKTVSATPSRSSQNADRLARRKTDTPPEEGELLDPIDLDHTGGGRSFRYSTASAEAQCDERGREKRFAGSSNAQEEEGEVEQPEETTGSASAGPFSVSQAKEGGEEMFEQETPARTPHLDTAPRHRNSRALAPASACPTRRGPYRLRWRPAALASHPLRHAACPDAATPLDLQPPSSLDSSACRSDTRRPSPQLFPLSLP